MVVLDDAELAVPLAQALCAGGIGGMEITFRTPAAAAAITAVRKSATPIRLGAGTLRTPADVERAVGAGAEFGVSPGATQALIAAVRGARFPWLPGAATASEAMVLAAAEFTMLKMFPASLASIDAYAGPLPDVRWVPTGGVDASNLAHYLERPNVVGVSGTWIAPRALIAARDFTAIERRAREASQLAESTRACL